MKWKLKDPEFGDMIRVKFGDTLYHSGIYVSDDEVIQFGLAPTARVSLKDSEIEVLSSDIDTFLAGGFLEVAEFDKKEKKKNRSPKETVEYARSKIGTRGYNLLYNNCEHFANECISGVHISYQASDVREMFRSMPVVDVYFGSIPENPKLRDVIPAARDAEIKSVSNERVRSEKYYAWRLLEYALERSLGLRMKKMEFVKHSNGRWSTPSCEFSISHSGAVVMVAVSRAPVGVDVELFHAPRSEKFYERIFNGEEKLIYDSLTEDERVGYAISRWTAKEAVFKSLHLDSFVPSKTAIDEKRIKTDKITVGDASYYYSVATDTVEKIRILPIVDLEKL